MKALASLLLLAPLLAGCAGLPFIGDGEITAKEAAAKALPRARAWHADAALSAVLTPEAPSGSPFHNQSGQEAPSARPLPDNTVGNGRAPQWYLHYRSAGANTTLEVAVFASGAVDAREREHGRDEAEGGVDEAAWQVDSPQAAQVAMEDANFSAGARAADGGIIYILTPAGIFSGYMGANASASTSVSRDPVWLLISGSESAGTGATVQVNARTGARENATFPFGPGGFNVTFPEGFPFSGSGPKVYHFSGSLTAAQPMAEHPFEVGAGHRLISASLTWRGAAPTDKATLQLHDAMKMELKAQDARTAGSTFTARYATMGPGTYQATVRLESDTPVPTPGIQVTYDLTLEVR